MRFENRAQLNVVALIRVVRKMLGSLAYAMSSRQSLKMKVSPSEIKEIDNWQAIGEMKAQIISHH